MAQMNKRKRTTTSLSLAALVLSLGIEPMTSEAQQVSETPNALPADPPPVTGGGATGGGGAGGGLVLPDPIGVGDTDTVGTGGQTYTYVAPPGSQYIFTQPPPSDYVFQPPGSGSCDGGTGTPFCRDTQKDCCPDPNVPNQYICCTPYTSAG